MLISPPFLPARGANDTDEAWLDLAMAAPAARDDTTLAPEGSFPLSHSLAWHNGLHIQAPAGLPVRAIADGIVRFVNPPRTKVTDVNDAQNYNPFARAGTPSAAWTDNGCVIIEHTTTIGAAGTTETQVVFYSVYMHLRELGRNIPQGQTAGPVWAVDNPIWRKDIVGQPGEIYGKTEQIHFEICCNQDQIRSFIGRDHNWINPEVIPAPTEDGRVDSIFGSVYFYLPANTPTIGGPTQPALHMRGAVAGTVLLGTSRWVRMTYHRGGCQFDSFTTQGVPAGTIGPHADEEYDLFETATARHDTLTPAQKATSSPSGWYELLRFGRNVGNGTTTDLLPATAAHWRQIQGPTGAVWADLNAEGTFKFSDADFLPMLGWNCVFDDATPNDQRCDSDNLKSVVRDQDPRNADRMKVEQLAAQLGGDALRKKLRKMICKFPTEWDRGTTAARYGFVQELDAFKAAPDAWPKLQAHLEAISFVGLHAGYLAADWHWHPREFIETFRKCGWLSAREMPQLVIRRTSGSNQIPITWAQANTRISLRRLELNRTLRKFGFAPRIRQAHFFGQCVQETDYLQAMAEYIGMAADYAPYIGRGFTQLTWAKNYVSYGEFRGFSAPHAFTLANFPAWYPVHKHKWYDGRPSQAQITQNGLQQYTLDGKTVPSWDVVSVATDSFLAVDTGGFYWVWKKLADSNTGHRTGQRNITRLADAGVQQADVDEVTYNINGGWNGRVIRRLTGPYAWRVLNDEALPAGFERQIP
jgi:hypothetical protein